MKSCDVCGWTDLEVIENNELWCGEEGRCFDCLDNSHECDGTFGNVGHENCTAYAMAH